MYARWMDTETFCLRFYCSTQKISRKKIFPLLWHEAQPALAPWTHLFIAFPHFYTNTRAWSSQSFPSCSQHNLQFGFISCAWESKDTTPRLLLAPLLPLLPPHLDLLHKGQADQVQHGKLCVESQQSPKPATNLWRYEIKESQPSRHPCVLGIVLRWEYTTQYYQPASSNLGQGKLTVTA